MKYRLFQYALPAPPELDDLNAYLASERVAAVARHVVQAPSGPMLVFLVQTLRSGGGSSGTKGEPRVDYRAVLDEEQFALFSRLRDERKRIAEEEGVPVYTIFSNAQLADMVRRRTSTPAKLAGIDGIGQARVEKYGPRILARLSGEA